MSRRLIIGILAILIVGVVGGTAYLVITRLRSDTPDETAQTPGSLPDSSGRQPVNDPTGDSDGDGLNNGDERLWGTNPNTPDTDGDGFSDGDEVTANHNPTIPGPNDVLPTGFEPGKDITPLDEASNDPIAVDQFFVNNLDLERNNINFTEEYRGRFGENDRTPDTLAQFARDQEIITQLPRPSEKSTLLQPNETPQSLADYLVIAGNLTAFSNTTIYNQALDELFTNKDASLMRGLSASVRAYQESLIKQPVPPSAQNLHALLLGYSELVAATYDQIARYSSDPVRAVVGVRQLEENDTRYFPLIQQEIRRLTAQAGS